MKRISAAERQAIERQRRGGAKVSRPTTLSEQPAPSAPRTYTRGPRSGARGWYASAEWKRRSHAHLKAHPDCVVCGGRATISDHIEWAHPDDRQAVLEGALQSMCGPCHQQKSADDRAKRAGRKPRPIQRRVEIDSATGLPKPGEPHWWNE